MVRYTVVIYPPRELNHSSYVQTGLFELEQMGLIKVKLSIWGIRNRGQIEILDDFRIKKTKTPQTKTSFYCIKNHQTGQKLYFAIDLYDHAERFSLTALENCDYIFKRNFQQRYVEALGGLGEKVHELGLTFGVHSLYRRKGQIFFLGLLVQNLKNSIKLDRRFFARLINVYKDQISHWNFVKTSRPIGMFEISRNEKSDIILFQTRCFGKESHTDQKELHKQRFRLINLLRKEFPDNFQGGFIASKIAEEEYSDALTDLSEDPVKYLNTVKKANIVIYTRGLAQSPAWKMAEYLSMGKVILAEPLHAELPIPLEDGKELLYFRNDAELIEKIKYVLSNRALAIELSKNARLYYERHVHPAPNIKRILEFMIKNKL